LKAGTTFVFRNGDDILHSVIGAKGEFRCKALDTGDRFLFTLAKWNPMAFFTPRSAKGHRVRVATAVMFIKGTLFLMACNDAVAPAVFVYAAPHQLAIV
jgi:hypothetical protein